MSHTNDRMKYLGALGLLAECSVFVPEDVRESIEQCFDDACSDGTLRWKRILDRIEIESVVEKTKAVVS